MEELEDPEGDGGDGGEGGGEPRGGTVENGGWEGMEGTEVRVEVSRAAEPWRTVAVREEGQDEQTVRMREGQDERRVRMSGG